MTEKSTSSTRKATEQEADEALDGKLLHGIRFLRALEKRNLSSNYFTKYHLLSCLLLNSSF